MSHCTLSLHYSGAILLIGAVVASAITSAVLTYHNNLGLSVLSGNPDAFAMIYIKPYTRIPPYLIGVAGGWFYWAWGEHITSIVHKTPMVSNDPAINY